MNIDKYINQNLDEILDNANEFIATKKKLDKKKKKVSWKEEIEETSKMVDMENEEEFNNDELEQELFEEYYNIKMEKEYLKSIGEYDEETDEHLNEDEKEEIIAEHKVSLLNLFLIHYNEKFNKCENYFSHVKNIKEETNNLMELFFEALVELKTVKQTLEIDENDDCMDYYFEDKDEKKVDEMFKKFPKGQMYCLDYDKKIIISPSILICLNYLINNKKDLFEVKNWNIFNLRTNK